MTGLAVRVHVHLSVIDIDASREFYEKLFDAEAAKIKSGYVKFLPDSVPVNLGLSETANRPTLGRPQHLGIQLDSTEQVQNELQRIKGCGLKVREEMGVDCCHANQDKFWVEDPDGLNWEVYNVNYDIEEEVLPQQHVRQPAVLQMAPNGNPAERCCEA